jgi:hypothetical protein
VEAIQGRWAHSQHSHICEFICAADAAHASASDHLPALYWGGGRYPGGGPPGGGMPGLQEERQEGHKHVSLVGLVQNPTPNLGSMSRLCPLQGYTPSWQGMSPHSCTQPHTYCTHLKPGGGMPGGGMPGLNPGGGMPGGGIPGLKPGGGMPIGPPIGGRIMGGACMVGRGIMTPGAGAPTPGAGPARPTGAAPGAPIGMPRPAARPIPGPACAAAPLASRVSSAGGGPSIVRSTTSSPRRMTRPNTRRCSRCTDGIADGMQGGGELTAAQRAYTLAACSTSLHLCSTSSCTWRQSNRWRQRQHQQAAGKHASSNARLPPPRPSLAAIS